MKPILGGVAMAGMVLFLAALAAGTGAAAPVVLVKDGKPAAAIVTAKTPVKSARLAALELQFHIRKITGAELPIVADDAPAPKTRILVGESAATAALGLKSADFAPQEYAISFFPGTVALIGRDKADTEPLDYASTVGKGFPDLFDEQGTMYATYDFLERFCDVRWYLPTDLGITYKERKTLAVSGKNVRRSPDIKKRFDNPVYRIPADLCGDTVRGNPTPPLAWREIILWHFRNRTGGRNHAVNHSFYGFYARFLKTKPLWFAQGYEGQPPQMCFSNEEFIAQVVQDARDYFDGKGLKPGAVAAGDYFALVPMDNSQWCRCPACQAQLTKGAVRGKGQFSNDAGSDYVFRFVNRVAREIKKSHPNKWVSTLAYMAYAFPPTTEPLESNVDVTLCIHTRGWHNAATRENDFAMLNIWKKTGLPLSLWMYYCFPALSATQGNYRVFAPFFGHEIVKQNPIFRKAGVRGMKYEPSYLAGSQQSPLLDQVEFYITWRLADNPELDGNRLISEFFARYYGAAAGPMRAFYETAEKAFWDPANHPAGVSGVEVEWGHLGTEERMKTLGSLMARAKVLARTDLEKQRVALFEKGIWQYMVKGRQSYVETSRVPLKSADVPRVAVAAGAAPASLDWSKAAVLADWKGVEGKPRADKRDLRMEGRLLHDGANLYVRLQDMTEPKNLVDRGNLWNDDEYEIFFGRERGPEYSQMGVNFTGRHETYRWPGAKRWESGVKVVSDCAQPDRWVLYLVFPLDKLLPEGVKTGDTFYMNAIRSIAVNNAVAWNPTLGGYHAPRRMGAVTLK